MYKTKKWIATIPGTVFVKRKIWAIAKVVHNNIFLHLRTKKLLRQLNAWEMKDRNNTEALSIIDRDAWVEKCRNIVINEPYHTESKYFRNRVLLAVQGFFLSPIKCLRGFSTPPIKNDIILVVTVKNDCSRLEHFFRHYRGMGVKYFAFIDNGSTDGTIEAILEQNDTACFSASDKYHSTLKTAWFNRVVAHLGINQWYMIVDSDELLVYPEMNKLNIQQYTNILDSNEIDFIRAVLVDVYPNGPLMDESKSDEEYLESCVYFDRATTLKQLKNEGLRSRLFLEDIEKPSPHKPILMRFDRYFLTSSHTIFPRQLNDVPHGAVALHYKFLPSDREKYINIAKEGNYYKGSVVYKEINEKIKETPIIDPMCELSVQFDAEKAWEHLPFIKNHVEGWDKLFLTGKYEKIGYRKLQNFLKPQSQTVFLIGLISDYRFRDQTAINCVLEIDVQDDVSTLSMLKEGCKRNEFTLHRFENKQNDDLNDNAVLNRLTNDEKKHFYQYRGFSNSDFENCFQGDKKIDMVILNGAQLHPYPVITLLRILPFLRKEALVIIHNSIDYSNPNLWGGSLLFLGWQYEKYQVVKLDKYFYPTKKAMMSCIKIPKDKDTLYSSIERIAHIPMLTKTFPSDDNANLSEQCASLRLFMQKHYDAAFSEKINGILCLL
ncbi:MAG: glycosyltransferase family 2 protein [Turicibacter sp.]|nr:glycosyltransferase family 2 protein [Turicibacter sp.]